jgi:hypothetical protein
MIRLSSARVVDAVEATALVTHRSSNGTDHTYIDQDVTSASTPVFAVTNFTGSAAGLDSDATTHAASDGSGHADVATNTTHSAGDGTDHTGIGATICDGVIAVANATGGSTTAALTLQLNDITGSAMSKVCVCKIVGCDAEYAGHGDQNANVTFSAATTGSILGSGSGWAIIKTDATGTFACTANNAVDETVWFSACDPDGGADALASGVSVRACIPDDATWSA